MQVRQKQAWEQRTHKGVETARARTNGGGSGIHHPPCTRAWECVCQGGEQGRSGNGMLRCSDVGIGTWGNEDRFPLPIDCANPLPVCLLLQIWSSRLLFSSTRMLSTSTTFLLRNQQHTTKMASTHTNQSCCLTPTPFRHCISAQANSTSNNSFLPHMERLGVISSPHAPHFRSDIFLDDTPPPSHM